MTWTARINTTYVSTHVGTGTYTRNILEALPEARRLRLPSGLLKANTPAFWSKRVAEVGLGLLGPALLHPYWAATASRRHILSILDFVQFDEATPVEQQMLARAARTAGSLLVLSDQVREQVQIRLQRAAVVAPAFPDGEWFAPTVPRPESARTLRLAYWGGFHQRKRITDLMCQLAADADAPDVELHHPGPPLLAFGEMGLRAVAYGELSAAGVRDLVDSCHVALYPSDNEGLGLPVFEALLRDRPLICAALTVYDEFSRPGRARLSWAPGQPVAPLLRQALSCPVGGGPASLRLPQREANVAVLREALLTAIEGRVT